MEEEENKKVNDGGFTIWSQKLEVKCNTSNGFNN
jgi:hypothetical protein